MIKHEDSLKHIGVKRRSGRYPWGSGKDGYQRGPSLRGTIKELRKQGLSEADIAKGMGMSTTEMRKKVSLERIEYRNADYTLAYRLREKGLSDTQIGERMGRNESSIRSLLNPVAKERSDITHITASILKDSVAEKSYIDVGKGVEILMGVSSTKLGNSVQALKEEGYTIHYLKVPQPGTGKDTSLKVLAGPGVTFAEVYANRDNIKLVEDYSNDGGRTWRGLQPITVISSDRVHIRYAEDGGADNDGVIELRHDVPDLSLDSKRYAQVRISVDGTHYLKGMAIYSDNIPNGKDIVYNTNKDSSKSKEEVFKKYESDADNPFGSTIRQKIYFDADGNEKVSALNIVGSKPPYGEEGSWKEWSNSLSSQFLSKQNASLAKKQLSLDKLIKENEFDEIMSLTNPAIRKKLLKTFSDDADKSAEDLKAAALPRQANHVIFPIKSMKENEVYAPNYLDNEPVVLIRHPHGGIFEIPELTVNNRNPEARKLLGNAEDAIGINPKVALKLSGADFDGDTVLVIPNSSGAIKSKPALKSLMEFEHRLEYKKYEGMPVLKEGTKQIKMGDISNLITDMTIKGAPINEVVRAVKHSMVVIDSVKHELNYKQSYLDNGIAALKKTYQGKADAGAATLISRASSQKRINEIDDARSKVDPVTGRKIYFETGATTVQRRKLSDGTYETVYNKDGSPKIIKKQTISTKMREETNAFKLSSGTKMEAVYAEYANNMKDMANKARLAMVKTKSIIYSPSANKVYKQEVDVLRSKLSLAERNAPMERQALLLANKVIRTKRADNPGLTPKALKKIRRCVKI